MSTLLVQICAYNCDIISKRKLDHDALALRNKYAIINITNKLHIKIVITKLDHSLPRLNVLHDINITCIKVTREAQRVERNTRSRTASSCEIYYKKNQRAERERRLSNVIRKVSRLASTF